MQDLLLKGFVKVQVLAAHVAKDQEGQDLIEYALVVALIAFAAVAGMNTLATKINGAFTSIGSTLKVAIP
ncbi:MAG TPA: Flp family type IVb pilin [Pyrinomonadaceae bacterium]|nr:Flp family type IVb pilin [Pyrinomonadaceae bacterium]